MAIHEIKTKILGAPIKEFLKNFKEVHKNSGGEVSLDTFIPYVRKYYGDKNAERIESRGSVTLTDSSQFSGRFQCSGKRFFFTLKGFRINFPANLEGDYIFDGDGLRLSFDSGATIYGSKWFIKVPLRRINMSSKRIDLDLEGDNHDISYIFV